MKRLVSNSATSLLPVFSPLFLISHISYSLFLSLSFFSYFPLFKEVVKKIKERLQRLRRSLLLDAEYLEPVIKFHLANVSEFESRGGVSATFYLSRHF